MFRKTCTINTACETSSLVRHFPLTHQHGGGRDVGGGWNVTADVRHDNSVVGVQPVLSVGLALTGLLSLPQWVRGAIGCHPLIDSVDAPHDVRTLLVVYCCAYDAGRVLQGCDHRLVEQTCAHKEKSSTRASCDKTHRDTKQKQ